MSQTAEQHRTDTSTIHEVVVGFDGSPPAHAALAWAIDEALTWRARLRVIVATSKPRGIWADAENFYSGWLQDAATHAENTLTGSAVPSWRVDLVVGNPAHLLADATRPDTLTVVGSTGHGAVQGSILGSVSQRLVEHARGPVVVCGRGTGRPTGPVVVGVDGSPHSDHAIELALSRSEIDHSTVLALYGWHGADRHGTPLAGAPLAVLAEQYVEAERWLAEALAGHESAHPDVRIERDLAPIPPAQALVDASSMASLVMVGTRGLGTVEGAVLGSVSRALLHGAHCPVAVVP